MRQEKGGQQNQYLAEAVSGAEQRVHAVSGVGVGLVG